MKTKILISATLFALLISFGILLSNSGGSQNQIKWSSASLDINNIRAQYTNYGVMYGTLKADSVLPGFEWPAGAGKYAISIGGPWIAGKVNGQLRVALVESSATFQPGKMFPDGSWDDPHNPRYQIYKFNYGDRIPAAAIHNGAPDSVWGDQMLWCVFNDADSSLHSGKFQTLPLGVEVQLTAFAYKRGFQGAENTVFNRWVIENRSNNAIDEMYFAFWFDPLIGELANQKAGGDSTLKLGYAYGATEQDNQYGSPPPAVGCKLLQGPFIPSSGDTAVQFSQRIPNYQNKDVAAFMAYYEISNLNIGYPWTPIEMYHFMTARYRDGSPVSIPTTDLTPIVIPVNYMYPGDPIMGSGWVNCDSANKKLLLSTGPFNMVPGDVQEIIFAVMVARGNSRLNSIVELKSTAATLNAITFPIPASIKTAINDFTLYQNFPNPFNPSTTIRFELVRTSKIALEIFDVLGKKINTIAAGAFPKGRYNRTWDGRDETGREVASGVYIYRLKAENQIISKKMLLLR